MYLIKKKFSLFIIVALKIFSWASWGLAATPYVLNAPLPGGPTEVSTFQDYIQSLFPFLLSLAAGLAFVAFLWGGIVYMTSAGNPDRMRDAKDRMLSAILGLLLAALSVIILRAINPALITLSITTPIIP